MAIGILIKRLDGSVTLVRKQVETLSEDPLTDHEQIINELHEQLKLNVVGVMLPSTEQAESFLIGCNLHPHTNQSLKVLTEDSEGAHLDKEDITNLIKHLTVYIGN